MNQTECDALAVAEPDPRAQLVPGEADLWQVDADLGRATRSRRRADERLPHADAILDAPAESRVERDDVAVLALDLEVHLEAAELAQAQLGLRDECASDAETLMLGCDGDAVEPAAVAVVARQGGADDAAVERRDQEELAPGGGRGARRRPPERATANRRGRRAARVRPPRRRRPERTRGSRGRHATAEAPRQRVRGGLAAADAVGDADAAVGRAGEREARQRRDARARSRATRSRCPTAYCGIARR